MATPINTFKTVTANLTTSGNNIMYTAPPITSTIILMAGQSFLASASANSALKLTLSLLETK